MFYAFQENDKNKINEFNNLFDRYTNYLINNNYDYKYWDLNHIQFIFLASNYINLCNKYGYENNIRPELIYYLQDECFYYSLSKREMHKIDENPQYSALIATRRDFELNKPISDLYQYHFMVMFNIKEFNDNHEKYKLSTNREKIVMESIELINLIYTKGVTFIDGDKWLMSVGAWDDNEDFAYMNYDKIEENMIPNKCENTTWDTSHFARVPVFLQIIKRANKSDSEMVKYYDRLILGLEEQFIENVLVAPDGNVTYYRTTNYMDGRNGLYRYNYRTQKGTAYLPYQLSGTMLLGWWSFLGQDMNKIYKKIYNTFPLNEEAIKTYVGPNTTRERNKYVKWPDFYENGFAKLVCLLSSKIEIDEIF